ncbi:hypothetical protein [Staphylococcus simulans]|uniref:hypothetical protein n=1 Tax=Staphylococcus simulans TaxID=1286 RepID=UPI0018EE68C2|nr:hypothetical protein [Staphylococcus simulans]
MKRWKDINFKQENRPTGIGITINAYNWFSPQKETDLITEKVITKDISALKVLVNNMRMNFDQEFDADTNIYRERLKAFNIVEPYTDTYNKMSFTQMEDFKNKLNKLYEDLAFASCTINLNEATERLNKQFGDSFPIISKEEIAETHEKNSIITDYPSANGEIHGTY